MADRDDTVRGDDGAYQGQSPAAQAYDAYMARQQGLVDWLAKNVTPRDAAIWAIKLSPLGAATDVHKFRDRAEAAAYEGRPGDAALNAAGSVASAFGLGPFALMGSKAAPGVAAAVSESLGSRAMQGLGTEAAAVGNGMRAAGGVGHLGVAATGPHDGNPDAARPLPFGIPLEGYEPNPAVRSWWNPRPQPVSRLQSDPAKVPEAPGPGTDLINFIREALSR